MLVEIKSSFTRSFSSGAHQDNHAIGIGCPNIVAQVVLAPDNGSELVHCFLHDRRAGHIEGIDRLAPLEVHIRILGSAANERVIR